MRELATCGGCQLPMGSRPGLGGRERLRDPTWRGSECHRYKKRFLLFVFRCWLLRCRFRLIFVLLDVAAEGEGEEPFKSHIPALLLMIYHVLWALNNRRPLR